MGNLESESTKITLDLVLNIKEEEKKPDKLMVFYAISLLVVTVLNLVTLYMLKHH